MSRTIQVQIPDDVYTGILAYTAERDQTPECFVESLLQEWWQEEQEYAKYDELFAQHPDWIGNTDAALEGGEDGKGAVALSEEEFFAMLDAIASKTGTADADV